MKYEEYVKPDLEEIELVVEGSFQETSTLKKGGENDNDEDWN